MQANDKSHGKKHEVWKDAFDVKECRTENFIMQKLNYVPAVWQVFITILVQEGGDWQAIHFIIYIVQHPFILAGKREFTE